MLFESSRVDFSSQSSAVCAHFPPLFLPDELSTPTPVRTVGLFSGDLLCFTLLQDADHHHPDSCEVSSLPHTLTVDGVSHSHPKHFT